MTGEKHTDHIENGQSVSRHSLPTLLYFLFYSLSFHFLKVFVNAKSISPPHIFLIQFYCHRTYKKTDKNSNSFYIEKRDSQNIKTIFVDTFQNDMNRIKEVLEEKGIKQTWLAEQLGKSYNMVNGYVQNRQQPRLEVLFEIAKILGVKPQELLKEIK